MEREIKQGYTYIDNSENPAHSRTIRNARALGIADIQYSSNITISNCVTERRNQFVFCLSGQLTKRIFWRWWKTEGYDAAVFIPDVERFADAITEADQKGPGKLSRSRRVERVAYVKNPINLREVDFIQNHFPKDIDQFGWQEELRISWPPSTRVDKPYSLHVPNLADYFEVVESPEDWLWWRKVSKAC